MASPLVFVDSVDEHKRQERLARLQNDENSRQAERERRRQETSSKADPTENVSNFLADWRTDQHRFEDSLGALTARPPAVDGVSRGVVKAEVEKVTGDIFRLEHLLANASYFLPPFEIRNLGGVITRLRTALDDTRAKLLPRQKFRFSRPGDIVLVDDPLLQGLTTRGRLASSNQCTALPETLTTQNRYLDPATTISKLSGTTIIKSSEDLDGKDWMLEDLQDCTIMLHGPMQALYLHRLRNCRVQAGPVSGATFGEELLGCTIMAASHQVRLHNTTQSSIYIEVGSDPIIEHSHMVGFAPLPALPYSGYADALTVARIQPGNSLWQKVQDFQYPGHDRSPNWFVIADEQRASPL